MKALVARSAARRAWLWRNRAGFGDSRSAGKPRLLVDVSTIIQHDAQTGIQRVVRAVWSELNRRRDQTFELVPVYATMSHGYCYAPLDFLDRHPTDQHRESVRAREGDKFLGLDLSAHLIPKYRQQLRSWKNYGATLHVIVYDLLPLRCPDWFSPKASKHFREWFRVVAEHMDQAICISNQVARDLRDLLGEQSPDSSLSITTMRLGGDIASSRPSQGICQDVWDLLDRLRFRPAVLMVGTVEPRKAYDVAIAAFERLWADRGGDAPDLVIVGKAGWKTRALQRHIRTHRESRKRLYWLEGVSDEGLSRLYWACRGLLMTSHGEGFGLPLPEAMVHGRRVLARDLPVFREQNLSHVMFFTDDRPAPLGEGIMDLVRAGPISAQAKQVPPTWSYSVDDLLGSLGLRTDGSMTTEASVRTIS